MAQHYTDFSEYTVGEFPADWSAPWASAQFTTVENDGAPHLYIASGNLSRIYAWGDIGSSADAEALYLYKANSTNKMRAHLRVSGTDTAPYSYYVEGNAANLRLFKHVGSTSATQIASVSPGFSTVADTLYWIRFRISGNQLYAKIWADGGSEPGSWVINGITDNDISGAGPIALGTFSYASVQARFYRFGVGTGGDVAPSSAPSGSPTINSITASVITASGARITLGLTR